MLRESLVMVALGGIPAAVLILTYVRCIWHPLWPIFVIGCAFGVWWIVADIFSGYEYAQSLAYWSIANGTCLIVLFIALFLSMRGPPKRRKPVSDKWKRKLRDLAAACIPQRPQIPVPARPSTPRHFDAASTFLGRIICACVFRSGCAVHSHVRNLGYSRSSIHRIKFRTI